MIESETVLVPDKNGPVLVPAGSLVYDNAPWLTSRLRQHNLRLVHPDVGNEVFAFERRSRRLVVLFLMRSGGCGAWVW